MEIRFDWSDDGSSDQAPSFSVLPPKAYVVTNQDRVGPRFDDRPADASLLPGPGCEALAPAGLGLESVRCPIPSEARALGPLVELGDRPDGVRIVMVEPDTRVYGGTGHDSIEGVGWLWGGPGDDEIAGGGRIFGGLGRDVVGDLSGPGRRSVRTLAAGDDVINLGAGEDVVFAGGGDDIIRARHGGQDYVTCSEGHDTVTADVVDYTFLGCERVRRAAPPRIIPELLFWSVLDDEHLELRGFCPSDGPTVCVGRATLKVGQRLIGAGPIRVRRGRNEFALVRVSWPIARLKNQRVRVTVRTYEPHGAMRRASRTLRVNPGDEESDGD